MQGGGSNSVTVTADPNIKMQSRQTTLNFSATGASIQRSVSASQLGLPFVAQVGIGLYTTYSSDVSDLTNYVNYDNINPTGGSQSSPLINGKIIINSGAGKGETEIEMVPMLAVLTSLVQGKKMVCIQEFYGGSNRTFKQTCDPNDATVGEYTIFEDTFSLTGIESSTNIKISIGLGSNNNIETYLQTFDFKISN